MCLQMLSPQADRMSYILFPRSHNFQQLNLIVLKIYKKLVAALALLPSSTDRRVDHSSNELSGDRDRATSVYGRRRSTFLFPNCSL